MKPYQYLIVWKPTEEEAKAGKKAKILIEQKTVLATDDKSAMLLAGRDIPAEYLDQINQMDVYVRPW